MKIVKHGYIILISSTNNPGWGNPTPHKTFNLEVAHDTKPVYLNMRPTLQNLIETAQALRVYFQVTHYEVYGYDEDAYADIYIDKITNNLPTLNKILNGHDVILCAVDSRIRIRIFEKYFE